MKKCRWGILSTAEISRKNWQAINLAGNAVVTGVASRSADRSRDFIQLCQAQSPFERVPAAYGSYEELIHAPDVDAIYIPLPTGVRKSWVIAAASAGKHVLCEKPCAASADDLRDMLGACRSAGVQFMDGVMYMHSNRLQAVRAALEDPDAVGDIRRICTQFSFCADDQWLATNIRLNSNLEPQGCLGDLGWYCIRFALWTMDWQIPGQVRGRMLTPMKRVDSPDTLPLEFSAELDFENRVTASFYCSFITHHQQWANISGNRGYLHINDFVLPYRGTETHFDISNAEFIVDKCDFGMENHRRIITIDEAGNSTVDSQETNLFRNFSDLVLGEVVDERWFDYSLKTQIVLDACLESARSGKAVAIAEELATA
jgi:predicted dehydrogenase